MTECEQQVAQPPLGNFLLRSRRSDDSGPTPPLIGGSYHAGRPSLFMARQRCVRRVLRRRRRASVIPETQWFDSAWRVSWSSEDSPCCQSPPAGPATAAVARAPQRRPARDSSSAATGGSPAVVIARPRRASSAPGWSVASTCQAPRLRAVRANRRPWPSRGATSRSRAVADLLPRASSSSADPDAVGKVSGACRGARGPLRLSLRRGTQSSRTAHPTVARTKSVDPGRPGGRCNGFRPNRAESGRRGHVGRNREGARRRTR